MRFDSPDTPTQAATDGAAGKATNPLLLLFEQYPRQGLQQPQEPQKAQGPQRTQRPQERYRPVDFAAIEAEHVLPAIAELAAHARQSLHALEHSSAPPTYANTLAALDASLRPLAEAAALVGHLESVASSSELREAYNAALPQITEVFAEVGASQGLWRRVQALHQGSAALSPLEQRHVAKVVLQMRKAGAALPAAAREELKSLQIELATLTSRFAQNVLDSSAGASWAIDDEARLSGLPAAAKEQARARAQAKSQPGWLLTLEAPCLSAVLRYLDDRSLRRALWLAYHQRAAHGETDNRPLLERIVALRQRRAVLLGYASFAHLTLDDRMAKDPKAATDLLGALRKASQNAFSAENRSLEHYVATHSLPGLDEAGPLAAWDVSYAAEKMRQTEVGFDEEALKPYFALDGVLDGLFDLAKTLFGVRMEPAALPCWHEEVRAYELLDESGRRRAQVYFDLFPRPNKRDGAWMNPLRTGNPLSGDQGDPHVAVVCANLGRPTSAQPALLSLREVETLFHEFGHLLHHCLTEVPLRDLAGTEVAWDFVELPSQIMENWVWERQVLQGFARHHATQQPLPDALYAAMTASRGFRAANAMMRQLGLASLDLELHSCSSPLSAEEALARSHRILAEHAPTPLPSEEALLLSFTHLFADATGYAAGYYSYKWAEVLDADAFERFREEGVLSAQVGAAFRQAILAQGDAAPPEELFRRFRGRDPDPKALLRRDKLIAA